VGGLSPVRRLSGSLRGLVGREEVLFWRSARYQGKPAYSLRLTPPFGLKHLTLGADMVVLERVREKESKDRLVFGGRCRQGFEYSVVVQERKTGIRLVEGECVVRETPKRKRKRGHVYVMNVRWIKQAKHAGDYAVDYELMLYR